MTLAKRRGRNLPDWWRAADRGLAIPPSTKDAANLTAADQHHRAALAVRERSAAADPANAQYQRDLSISHNKLGDLAVAAGDTTTADQHYRTALTIAERLAAADPANAGYQRDLAYVRRRLAELPDRDPTP